MNFKSHGLAALAALIVASGMTLARAAEKIHVATPSRVIFAIPFWVAEQKGYFKDEGIEATLEVVGSGKEITQRLKSGASQFSIVGPDASIIDAMNGGPQRIVAGIVRKPPLFLIAKPGIKTFADLRGANIGALSLTEGSSKLLVKMARAEGLTRDDLQITAVGGAPARHILLKDGKIDAGMQPMPLNYEAVALGFNNLGWAGKYEPDWQFATVNTDGEWARRNPQLVTGFIRALLRGQQFIFANPDEAAKAAAQVLKTPEPMAARAIIEAVRLGILDPRLNWSELGLSKMYENMQADGVMPADRKFDVSKVVDDSYLRNAQGTVTRSGGK
jgi:ABC-type nitrate/sulfonate/bicarbonate transport system substrate-binding protein